MFVPCFLISVLMTMESERVFACDESSNESCCLKKEKEPSNIMDNKHKNDVFENIFFNNYMPYNFYHYEGVIINHFEHFENTLKNVKLMGSETSRNERLHSFHVVEETCSSEAPCEEKCGDETCNSMKEQCNITNTGLRCICKIGFQSVYGQCLDINECVRAACDRNLEVCINLPGSFSCECRADFERIGNKCVFVDQQGGLDFKFPCDY